MASEKYEFKGMDGNILAGNLEIPDEKPLAYGVFAHCFTCSKDFVASRTIARALARRSIGVLRFDFTGLGNSEGDFSNTNFSSNIEDLIMAVRALAHTHEMPKIMLGHSLGGAAALAASAQLPDIKAVSTIGAPFDPAHIEHLFCNNIDDIERDGMADVMLFGRQFSVKRQFINDINNQDNKARLSQLKKPLMIMHSPTDTIVGIENARMIYECARHPKNFISLDGIDHLLTQKQDAEYVADILTAWVARYV